MTKRVNRWCSVDVSYAGSEERTKRFHPLFIFLWGMPLPSKHPAYSNLYVTLNDKQRTTRSGNRARGEPRANDKRAEAADSGWPEKLYGRESLRVSVHDQTDG